MVQICNMRHHWTKSGLVPMMDTSGHQCIRDLNWLELCFRK